MRSLSFLDTVFCLVATFLVIASLGKSAPDQPEAQPGILLVLIQNPPAHDPKVEVQLEAADQPADMPRFRRKPVPMGKPT